MNLKQLMDANPNVVMIVVGDKAAGPRPLRQIAHDIYRDWKAIGKGVSPYAKPYLEAMMQLDSINDRYYEDSAEGVVLYFLANAQGYRGAKAKALKAELKAIAKIK